MNIRVDLNTNIADGSEVVFRSPADCSQVTGLVIYHNDGKTEFAFADAHGNNVGDIDHLFAENAVVKVILDVTAGMAFVQNADTNAYIESTFIKSVNGEKPDSNGNVQINVGNIKVDNYVDMTEAYEMDLKSGTVTCAREYLWTLGEGRWSLVDGDEKYYLQVFVGDFDEECRLQLKRILFRCWDFIDIEIYTGVDRFDNDPDIKLDGETGEMFANGMQCNPTDLSLVDGKLYFKYGRVRFGDGVDLTKHFLPKNGDSTANVTVNSLTVQERLCCSMLRITEMSDLTLPPVDLWIVRDNSTSPYYLRFARVGKDVVIGGIADPERDNDAATKGFVARMIDEAFGGLINGKY